MDVDLETLILSLTEATAALRQAALADDWSEVERVQRLRAPLAERILRAIERGGRPDAPGAERLYTAHAIEQEVMAQAEARRRQLERALTEVRSETHRKQVERLRRAYDS